VEQQGSSWTLRYGGGAGSDRKITGSYYATDDALVEELTKSALVPVIDDQLLKASDAAERRQALLKIKAIDPACGSGHFLLAAARRLAGDNTTVCTSLKKESAAARKTVSRRGSNRGSQGRLNLSGTQPQSRGQLE